MLDRNGSSAEKETGGVHQKALFPEESHNAFRPKQGRHRCSEFNAAFTKSESKMNATQKIESLSNKIADAIVDLVNATDGPVTFSRIDIEVRGFASKVRSTWDYLIDNSGKEFLIWGGMSEAGFSALSKVISGRRVAIQYVNVLPYMLDDRLLYDDDWLPAVLVPAKAANLETPRRLLRISEYSRTSLMKRAVADGKSGYRMLKPSPLRFTADQFSF